MAMNGFCGWGNVEGEILSNPGIVTAVLKDSVEISQDPVSFPLSEAVRGARGRKERQVLGS